MAGTNTITFLQLNLGWKAITTVLWIIEKYRRGPHPELQREKLRGLAYTKIKCLANIKCPWLRIFRLKFIDVDFQLDLSHSRLTLRQITLCFLIFSSTLSTLIINLKSCNLFFKIIKLNWIIKIFSNKNYISNLEIGTIFFLKIENL